MTLAERRTAALAALEGNAAAFAALYEAAPNPHRNDPGYFEDPEDTEPVSYTSVEAEAARNAR
jgi:hypothetical protein